MSDTARVGFVRGAWGGDAAAGFNIRGADPHEFLDGSNATSFGEVQGQSGCPSKPLIAHLFQVSATSLCRGMLIWRVVVVSRYWR